jgi:serine/threonine protein kinase
MEYVAGRDLRQVFDHFREKNKFLPFGATAYLTRQICEGLAYAHNKKDISGRELHLIHRDVSPQNILIGYQGEVKITDFGIVKAEDRGFKTQAGVLKGKFGYMSPEQVRGLPIDHRSDLFALGILLYEAMTNHRLFVGESDFVTLEKVRSAEIPDPTQYNDAIPPLLTEIVLKSLAKEREERYADGHQFSASLLEFSKSLPEAFGALELQQLMEEEFKDELKNEAEMLQNIMNLAVPTDLNQENPNLGAALQFNTGEYHIEDDPHEKTMIFESSGLPQDLESIKIISTESPLSESKAQAPDAPVPGISLRQKIATAWKRVLAFFTTSPKLAWSLFTISLIIIGISIGVWWRAQLYGSLEISTKPQQVTLFLDGIWIGDKTPIKIAQLKRGQHVLVAQAKNYEDKAYRFELSRNSKTAHLEIALEPKKHGSKQAVALDITSDPSNAEVKIGHSLQGYTPYRLWVHDIREPVVFDVLKTGFAPQRVSLTLNPNEKQREVHILLIEDNPQNSTESETSEHNKNEPAEYPSHRVRMISKPAGAAVFLNGKYKGTTPLNLSVGPVGTQYRLRLIKKGYAPYERLMSVGKHHQWLALLQPNAKSMRKNAREPAHTQKNPKTIGEDCGNSGSTLSLTTMGIFDCKVRVNHKSLGIAPFLRKPAPIGQCLIEVDCPGGKHYQKVHVLKPGAEEKIVIRAEDW